MRFYVQDPHIDGYAVIDSVNNSMVISSFGDTEQYAKDALLTVARALNAATEHDYEGHRTDAFKLVYPSLNWRVIECLSAIILGRFATKVGD